MKLSALVFAAFSTLLVFSCCKKDDDPVPTPEPGNFPSKLEEKTFISDALVGNFFGDPADRRLLVYTPKDYDPDGTRKYPVVYLLHGLPLGDSTFVNPALWTKYAPTEHPDFPAEGFQVWMDSMIARKAIDPMLVVMPDAGTKYGFCFYTNSILQGNYEDFIAYDLVKYMDTHYKTIAAPAGRAVVGHSQGGYGALRMGMYHPDVFGMIASLASIPYFEGLGGGTPYIIAENPNGMHGPLPQINSLTTITYGMSAAWSPNLNNPPYYVDLPFNYPSGSIRQDVWNSWFKYDPYTLLDSRAYSLKSLKGFYMDAGTSDAWKPLSDVYHNGLTTRAIPHKYVIYNGGHHDRMFLQIEGALRFCSDLME